MTEKKIKKPKGKEEIRSVKGMRDIIGDVFYSYQGFFERAAEIAMYYGFKPIETPVLEKTDLFIRSVGEETDIVGKEMYSLKTKGKDNLTLRPEGTASVMRAYIEQGMQTLSQPVMLYYYGPFFRHEKPQKGRYRQFYQFGFEVIGSPKSINDALVIKMTVAILEEVGIKDIRIKINSIGDKECRGEYKKELVSHYRKHAKEICADCKQRIKTNPLRMLDCKDEKCQKVKESAPETIGYLCTECKKHFREVLEYLETLGVPYEIDKTLVRGLDYYTKTVFEVVVESEEEDEKEIVVGGGGRYDYLARAIGSKKDVPAVGVSLGVDRILNVPERSTLTPRILKKPKVFFIQLGFDAKLKSINVIEVLRKAKVPVSQSLTKDSIGAQLGIAERLKVPHTIILGQKEALENSVIVRNMETRSQDTVKIDDLADYLKKIK